MTAYPDNPEIIFFGGEYYNGSKTQMFNDLLIYNTKRSSWSQIISPAGPPPRSAHQVGNLIQIQKQLTGSAGPYNVRSSTDFLFSNVLTYPNYVVVVCNRTMNDIGRVVGPKFKHTVLTSSFQIHARCRCCRHTTKMINLAHYSKAETISKLTVHSQLLQNYFLLQFVNYEVWSGCPKLGQTDLLDAVRLLSDQTEDTLKARQSQT